MLLLYLHWKYVEVGYLGRSSSDGIALKIPNIRFLPSNFTSMVSNEKMGIRFKSYHLLTKCAPPDEIFRWDFRYVSDAPSDT